MPDVTPPRRPRKAGARKAGPVPDIFSPQAEAHRLRQKGLEWTEIAGLTGYGHDASACRMAYQAYLQKAALAESEEQRALALAEELARLNRLQVEWWDEATTKRNLDAAKFVLQLIQYRAKLRQLERPANELDGAGEVLVISGSEEEYVARLRQIAEAG